MQHYTQLTMLDRQRLCTFLRLFLGKSNYRNMKETNKDDKDNLIQESVNMEQEDNGEEENDVEKNYTSCSLL